MEADRAAAPVAGWESVREAVLAAGWQAEHKPAMGPAMLPREMCERYQAARHADP